jgi:hypothetical protein
MEYDPVLGRAQSTETVMVFGTCELTSTQFQTEGREDLLDRLMRSGVKRIAAERILEIHCSDDASPGRARAHATSRTSTHR